jgi:hypothetical protein
MITIIEFQASIGLGATLVVTSILISCFVSILCCCSLCGYYTKYNPYDAIIAPI